MTEVGRFRRSPPSSQRDADGAGGFRCKLQPPRCGHRQPHQLGDNGAEPAKTQTLLEIGEHILFPVGFNIDYPVVMEPCLGQRRCKQVRPRQTPENVASGSRSDASDKQGSRCSVNCIGSTSGHLMQGAKR